MVNEFFKAYIPTKNKKSVMSFKDKNPSELLSLEDAEKLSEYGGILSDDCILLDFDDEVMANKALTIVKNEGLKCRVVATSRGYHMFFKNTRNKINRCCTHASLACGLVADIKLGTRNSYAICKFNDKTREIIYDICLFYYVCF